MPADRVSPEVRVYPDAAALSVAAAAEVARLAADAVARRGRFTLALSGGSTPRRLYELLAERVGVPWESTHLFWGDERCVPPDHPLSNYAMARAALIARVPIPAAQVHRIHAEADPPEAGAAAYAALLRHQNARAGTDGPLAFDLVLLGMGADGHTASLFPGDAALDERERWAVAVTAPPFYDPRRRITLTLPVLNAARAAFFLIAGADKRPVVRAVLDVPATAEGRYPAAMVRPAGPLVWFLDEAARGAPDR